MDEIVEMTQEEYDSLKLKLENLEGPGRQEIVDAIAFSREFGDITENAEYLAARDEQVLLEIRILRLRARFENASIVESRGRVIDVGSVVEIEEVGGERTRVLVSNVVDGHTGDIPVVSPASPLGRALMGIASGAVVEVRAPRGPWKAKVISVRRK